MGFEALDEVAFCKGDRFRVSDRARLLSYTLVRNYGSALNEEPTRAIMLGIVRGQYENNHADKRFEGVNAFWFDAYEFDGAWQIRYGFGKASYLPAVPIINPEESWNESKS